MNKSVTTACMMLILCCAMPAVAQIYGIRAGFNLANMNMKYDGETVSDDLKMKPGFLLGPTAEFPISPALSIESGLLLSTKGFKVEEKETFQTESYVYKSKLNLLYLDIPVALKGKINVGENTNLFLSGGPYFAVGLSGTAKSEYSYNGETEKSEESIEWGSDPDEDDLRPLDIGLTFGGGVEYAAFQFGVYYDLGLMNISPYTDDGMKIRNRNLNFSLTYRFIKG